MDKHTPQTAWLNDIELVGGHSALDFVNTVHTRLDPEARDYLATPAHLIGWFLHQNLITATDADRLARMPESEGQNLLETAGRLRTTLDAILQGRLDGIPNTAALADFNQTLGTLGRWHTLAPTDAGFTWRCGLDSAHPQSLLAPLAFAAAALLVSADLDRLKACPEDTCRWLFLDRSRNGSRHWCSMKTCGNVAKLRRYRARQKNTAKAH